MIYKHKAKHFIIYKKPIIGVNIGKEWESGFENALVFYTKKEAKNDVIYYTPKGCFEREFEEMVKGINI